MFNYLKYKLLLNKLFCLGNFNKTKSHLCISCGKAYVYSHDLKRHQRIECGGKEPLFQCPMCPQKCRYKFALQSHVINKHRIISFSK